MDDKESKGPRPGFRGVPRQVRAVILLTSFAAVGLGYMFIYLTAYLPNLGFSPGDIGLIIGTMSIATIFTAIPFGLYSDRVGRKKVLLFSLASFPLILLVLGLYTDLLTVLVVAIFAGVAEGAFLTAWNALIADQTNLDNRNAAFALSFIVNTSAMGIGSALPFLFPLIEDASGLSTQTVHSWALLLIAASCVITPLGIYLELKDYKEVMNPVERRQSKLRAETKRNLVRFSLVNMLIGLGAGFSIALIPTWLLFKFEVPDAYSGPLLALSSITMAFASIASARIAFRYGSVKAIALTQGLSTIFLALIPLMPIAVLASAAFVIRSMFMNMSAPIADSFLMSIISKEDRGLASAINNIIWRLPNSITTIFGGMLMAAGFYDLPFYITAVCYVTAIVLFYVLFKNIRPLE